VIPIYRTEMPQLLPIAQEGRELISNEEFSKFVTLARMKQRGKMKQDTQILGIKMSFEEELKLMTGREYIVVEGERIDNFEELQAMKV